MTKPELNTNKSSFTVNKGFDLDILWMVIRKHWVAFPILIIIALTSGFIYLRYTKPVYASTAIIQRSSQDEGKRILDIDNFEREGGLSEDVELLKSTFLLEKALRNLNLKMSYYSEGEILTEEKYLMSSYHITLLELKDSLLIGTPINISKSGEKLNLSFEKQGEEQVFELVPGETLKTAYFDLIFKINDQKRFEESVDENRLYFQFNNYPALTRKLHPDLKVFILNPEAKTVQIEFESNNPRLATDVVSSLIATFFQYDLDKKSESSANILNFINSQLDTAFSQLKESEVKIQSFKDSNQVNNPALFTQRIMQQTSELQNQLMDVDLELELIEDVGSKVDNSERLEIYKLIPAVTGTQYEKLFESELQALHELLVRKEDVSYNVTADNSILKRINRKIESRTENIKRSVASVKEQLIFKKSSILNKIQQLEASLYGIPEKEMELSRLNRMFNLNEKYYSLLIEKKTQYAISKAGYTTNNMVLQAPSSIGVISPNNQRIYTVLFVLSFLIGFVYLAFRYLRFNEIQHPDELKRILPNNVGFLGILPKLTSNFDQATLMVHERPKSALSESCRNIRSNMQFVLDENKPSVVAVSSSVSGEGKTFLAINIGGVFALSGKRVLVIDLDLRKPKVHRGFNTENKNGMSAVLAGKTDWQSCVNHSEIEGLDYITAGPIPPNPSELILRGHLDELLASFKKSYDMIIIDNPPVGMVSDGVIVMNKADCPIYVFRSNYSKRRYMERVTELLDGKMVSQLFVVLNGVDMKKRANAVGYGYGYSQYYTDEKSTKRGLFKRRRK